MTSQKEKGLGRTLPYFYSCTWAPWGPSCMTHSARIWVTTSRCQPSWFLPSILVPMICGLGSAQPNGKHNEYSFNPFTWSATLISQEKHDVGLTELLILCFQFTCVQFFKSLAQGSSDFLSRRKTTVSNSCEEFQILFSIKSVIRSEWLFSPWLSNHDNELRVSISNQELWLQSASTSFQRWSPDMGAHIWHIQIIDQTFNKGKMSNAFDNCKNKYKYLLEAPYYEWEYFSKIIFKKQPKA